MPSNKPIRSFTVFAMSLIFCLLLVGCGAASPAQNPTQVGRVTALPESNEPMPTPMPSITMKPDPTVSPVESATPTIQKLLLHEQGFAQTGRQLLYGFVIENPNSLAISNTGFQIQIHDENGVLQGIDEESIPLLLPGQLLGIAGSVGLNGDSTISQMNLEISTGNSIELAVLPELEVIGVNYHFSEIYSRVTGLIRNEAALTLEDIRVSAIAFGVDGRIVGAGYTFVSFLPAREETGVDIVLTANEPIERVALYPRASLPALLSSSQERPPFTSELDILDQGFSQDGIEVGYGFLVTNPNPLYALENSEYLVTFFNDRREVIAVNGGYIDLLVPQQIFGVGDHVFVDEGETVYQMAVLVRPSKYTPAISEPMLLSENVEVVTGTLGTIVKGEIINPYLSILDNLRVSAVIYDIDGQIVGGGYDWIDNVPPDGRVLVELWVTAPGGPASAELYAAIAEIIRE